MTVLAPAEVGRAKASGRLTVGCWPGRSFDLNPFVRQFQASLEAAGCEVVDVSDPRRIATALDVLHIHWPEQVFWNGGGFARMGLRTVLTLHAIKRLKRAGAKVVWMVHNLRPHELSGGRGLLWRLLGPATANLADGFMTLSPATVETVQKAFPGLRGKAFAYSWHPVPEMGPSIDRAAARRAEGWPETARVYAFLGLIRPYKGVEALIEAFRARSDPNQRLVIGGRCDSSALGARLRLLAQGDERIQLGLERLDDWAFARKAAASDIFVLPFVDYLHSASIVHALSHRRPVITPTAPYADALANAVGPGWIKTYVGKLSPSALAFGDLPEGTPDLSELDTAKLGAAACALYERLVHSAASHGGRTERPG